jgi:hypothetical protein
MHPSRASIFQAASFEAICFETAFVEASSFEAAFFEASSFEVSFGDAPKSRLLIQESSSTDFSIISNRLLFVVTVGVCLEWNEGSAAHQRQARGGRPAEATNNTASRRAA